MVIYGYTYFSPLLPFLPFQGLEVYHFDRKGVGKGGGA